ncbi:MAG: hypothetical protein FWE45_02095 [Firmicutes bacterium]|nr:hypothetical protein [Bacillota bacterium]
MFHFYQQGNKPSVQAVTQREDASMRTLGEAFGNMPSRAVMEDAPIRSQFMDDDLMDEPVMAHPTMMNFPIDPMMMGMHEVQRTPARAPRVERSTMGPAMMHLAPEGHRLEEHHIWENCKQGRKRNHCEKAVRADDPEVNTPMNENAGGMVGSPNTVG